MHKLLFACAAIAAVASFGSTPEDFKKQVEITLTNNLAAREITTGLPALVKLSEATIAGFDYDDFSLAGGGDMMFTDVSGNVIPHEVDTWNTNGVSLVWVRLPSTAADTKIWMYYGNGATSSAASTAVWSDYFAVWHLNEAGAANENVTVSDSTANGFDGLTAGIDTSGTASGKIGAGWRISDDANEAKTGGIIFSSMTNAEFGTQFTVSGWAWHKDQDAYFDHLFYRKNASTDNTGFCTELYAGNIIAMDMRGSETEWDGTHAIRTTRDVWAHLAFTYDGTSYYAFCDGEQTASATGKVGVVERVLAFSIGTDADANDISWKGIVDEVRIRKGAYDTNYLAAEYKAMNTSDSDIFDYGPVAETLASGVPGLRYGACWCEDGAYRVSAQVFHADATCGVIAKDPDGAVVGFPAGEVSADTYFAVTLDLDHLTENKRYTISAIAENAYGACTNEICELYVVIPTAEKIADASVIESSAGAFRLSIPAALAFDLDLYYSLGGNAVAGRDYVDNLPGLATIPAGETSVGIPVTPIANLRSPDNCTLTLTPAGGAAATMVIDVVTRHAYSRVCEITLSANLAATEITSGLPALVRLSEAKIAGFDYDDFKSVNGGDMLFTDASGNVIPHEVDTWSTNGESLVWVRLPSTAANTKIKMYYGKGRTPLFSPSAVWVDYFAVWHLNEAGAANENVTVYDSTTNGFNGTTIGHSTSGTATGKVGAGWRISDDGTYGTAGGINFDSMTNAEFGTQFTMSCWVWHKDQDLYWDHFLYRKNSAGDSTGFATEIYENKSSMSFCPSEGSAALAIDETRKTWAHIALAFDGVDCYSFCNGSLTASANAGKAVSDRSLRFAIGTDSDNSDISWKGIFDEVRIRKGAYDANYLAAEYSAMNTGDSDIFMYGASMKASGFVICVR